MNVRAASARGLSSDAEEIELSARFERVRETPVSLDLQPIFRGPTSPLTEIVVDIRTRDAAFEGDIELVLDDEYDRVRSVHREAVKLGSQAAIRRHLPARAGQSYSVRVVASGRLLVQEHISLPSSGVAPFVLSAGLPVGEGREFARLLGDFPEAPGTYDAVGVFLLSSTWAAEMREQHCAPLRHWVRTGGSLVIATENVESDPPCDLGHERTRLATFWSVGRGSVRMLNTANVNHELVTKGSSSLVRMWHGDETPTIDFDPTIFAQRNDGPKLAALCTLLAGFAVAGGPVLFGRLRRRKKTPRVLTWLPLFSVGGFISLLALGFAFREHSRTRSISIRDYESGNVSGHEQLARGFMAPPKALRVKPALVDGRVSSGIDEQGYAGRGDYRLATDGSYVLNEQGLFTDFVYLIETKRHELDGPITLACSAGRCSVTNESGEPLEDAIVWIPNAGIFHAGRIDKSLEFELTTRDPRYKVGQEFQPSQPIVARHLAVGLHMQRHNVPATLVARRRGVAGVDESYISVACNYGCQGVRHERR